MVLEHHQVGEIGRKDYQTEKEEPFFSFFKPLFVKFLFYARHCCLHRVCSLMGEYISTFSVASDRNQLTLA